MKDLTNLRVRNIKYPYVVGTVLKAVGDEECPEREGFPRTVLVKWDDCFFPVVINLKHLESAS